MSLPKPNYHYSKETDRYEEELRKITYSEKIVPRSEKILFIIPPSPQESTPGREFLITGPFEGFTYIATLVKRMGFNLQVLDCRLKVNLDQLVLEAAKDVDLIGITSYADSFNFLEKMSGLLKQNYPDKTVLLGGPLVTSLPEVLLENTEADLAILGEAELTLIEFLNSFFSDQPIELSKIKGLAFKNKIGEIVINPHRPQIKNLDNLPILDYRIWENYEDIIKNGQILISSTRGCTQSCSFCFKTIPGLRQKSIKRFEEEVKHIKKETNFNYTWLNDLTFNIDEARSMEICDILQKNGIEYHVFARVINVNPPLMNKLKETGCLGIWFGFESYEQHILNENRKNIKTEDIDHALKVADDAGLAVRGLFIVGLFQETEKALKDMLNFIRENENFLPLVKYLVPFPGTSLFQYSINEGKIKSTTEFLRMMSVRKVRDFDDEIINITDLDDQVLRKYFQEIWKITKEREKQEKYAC
jgi:anaerobic magnesium-protoporphyrin IX monomethyl ester cyclase